jgi:membrane protease YdiL (CAAX protease family)
MNNRAFFVILPVLVWLGLLFILWLTSLASGFVYYVLACVSFVYEFAVPSVIVRAIEKQNLTERFGFQSWRKGILFYLIFASTLSVQFSVGLKWEALLAILFAPILEEFFFRGYFLGSFRNEKTLQYPIRLIGSILLSSIVFSLSHVFVRYNLIDYLITFCLGLLCGFVYVFSGSVVYSVPLHMVFNFIIVNKGGAISPTSLWIWVVIFLLPYMLLAADLLRKRRRKTWRIDVNSPSLSKISSV